MGFYLRTIVLAWALSAGNRHFGSTGISGISYANIGGINYNTLQAPS